MEILEHSICIVLKCSEKMCALLEFCKNYENNISNPKQPAVKKVCSPQKGYGEKRCEIQGGGQEMAVMVG